MGGERSGVAGGADGAPARGGGQDLVVGGEQQRTDAHLGALNRRHGRGRSRLEKCGTWSTAASPSRPRPGPPMARRHPRRARVAVAAGRGRTSRPRACPRRCGPSWSRSAASTSTASPWRRAPSLGSARGAGPAQRVGPGRGRREHSSPDQPRDLPGGQDARRRRGLRVVDTAGSRSPCPRRKSPSTSLAYASTVHAAQGQTRQHRARRHRRRRGLPGAHPRPRAQHRARGDPSGGRRRRERPDTRGRAAHPG